MAKRPISEPDKNSGDEPHGVPPSDETVSEAPGAIGNLDPLMPLTIGDDDAAARWSRGRRVAGRFRIERFIGQGGMGKVYLAQDEMLGRPVALKRIPPEVVFDIDARDGLREEANRLLDLAHENVVRIHTYYAGPTWPFIAMELLQGPTLKKLLRERKQLGETFNAEELACIARQVAHGLSYAHAKGIVHRDLKPANLMLAQPIRGRLTDTDVVKITDFGVSRVVADSALRQTGKRSGTLPYMSPEQYRGDVCGPRSDVYSFACSLYELATGQAPFHSGEIGHQILHRLPARPAGLPEPMADAILRGMAKEPSQRFGTVEEFVDALEGKPSRALAAPAAGRPLLAKVAAAVIVVGLLLLALSSFFESSPRQPGLGGDGPRVSSNLPESIDLAFVPQEQLEREFQAFRDEFLNRFSEQVPGPVGRRDTRASVSGDQLALNVYLPPGRSTLQKRFYEGLAFQYFRVDEGYHGVGRAAVQGRDGNRRVLLDGLQEGRYSVQGYIQWPENPGGHRELFDDPFRFEVDLTPPEVTLHFASPEVLVETRAAPSLDEPDFYSTFDGDLRVQIGQPGDIAMETAEYRLAHEQQAQPWRPVDDPDDLQFVLSPGENVYDIRVRDYAGNQSLKRFRFYRLSLELQEFELAAPVVGNLALARGVLRVEGDRFPGFVYRVNDKVITPVDSQSQVLSSGPAAVPGQGDDSVAPVVRRVAIQAEVELPEAVNNTIEVQYAWSDSEPRQFTTPRRINSVDVRAPEFVSLQYLERTTKKQVRVQGTLAPYFDGLEMTAEILGRSSKQVRLTPTSAGVATFSHLVDLWSNRENVIQLIASYKGHDLVGSASDIRTVTVQSDQTAPRLAERILFETVDSFLRVQIRPDERLALLRIKVQSEDPQRNTWQVVEPVAGSLTYRYVHTIPRDPTLFLVEMTDLVGHTSVEDAIFPETFDVARPTAASTRGVLDHTGLGGALGKTEGSPRPGVVALRSPFLREMGMEFRPFGQGRQEMGLTEVPERVWFEFLRDAVTDAPRGVGRLNYPMTLGSRPAELLQDFAEWFEEKAADGYEYSVPSVADWLGAFSNEAHPAQARAVIRKWFAGEREDGKKFIRSPDVRYGWNQAKHLGSRKENVTPTGFLDMESNVQEIVLRGVLFYVMGAHNGVASASGIERRCLTPRPFTGVAAGLSGAMTGLRLLRRPAMGSTGTSESSAGG